MPAEVNNDYQLLLDELARIDRKPAPRASMAKSIQVVPLKALRGAPTPSFRPLLRDIAVHEREMRPVRQAVQRDRLRAGIARADAMLKSLVAGGKITAVEAAKGEWHLNQLRAAL